MDHTMFSNKAHWEYEAWKDIVKVLKEEGLDINECDAVKEAIRYWGHKFHEYQMDMGK